MLNKVIQDEALANSFHWHVMLESQNDENGEMKEYYEALYSDFMETLSKANP